MTAVPILEDLWLYHRREQLETQSPVKEDGDLREATGFATGRGL
jgi:hypothetical protein